MIIDFEKRDDRNIVIIDGGTSVTFQKNRTGIDLNLIEMTKENCCVDIRNFHITDVKNSRFKQKINHLIALWKFMK